VIKSLVVAALFAALLGSCKTDSDSSEELLHTGQFELDLGYAELAWDCGETTLTLSQSANDGKTIKLLARAGDMPEENAPLTDQYDGYFWTVDLNYAGDRASFTVFAADYTTGSHTLLATAYRDGSAYSKALTFTVVP
jgi:hypothetical protein